MDALFSQVPQPLAYAQRCCAHYSALALARSTAAIADQLVAAACDLSGCELAQLFWRDAASGRLRLLAQMLDGQVQSGLGADIDHGGEPLLRLCAEQDRLVSIAQGDGAAYPIDFLPKADAGWNGVLCQPLRGTDGQVCGVLLCATARSMTLDLFAPSLASLGGFAIAQMQLLRRLEQPACDSSPAMAAHRPGPDYGLIGASSAMVRTRQLITKVLAIPHTVLLTGETGTGKEVVSRAIHEHGPRRAKAFVVQNCAAFPESLLESELFGYRKGAFTGADRDHAGLFDVANGGTLMLDEIGDMPLSLQAKLLRVLQEGEIRPLGSSLSRKVDVRVIAATHRDLPAMIAAGQFRADLYYRLVQFPIELPALRQRENDVIELARHFAADACGFLQREPVHWSDAALTLLAGYEFPGNVRELKGMVERAVLMCEGDCLRPEDFNLGGMALTRTDPFNLRERLEAYERDLLLQCLHSAGGNRSLAARWLGVARRTLLYRMAHLDISPVSARAGG